MSDLSAQFFHLEDLFCISTLSHERHTPKSAAKSESHTMKPERDNELPGKSVEYDMLPASLKEVMFLILGNDWETQHSNSDT